MWSKVWKIYILFELYQGLSFKALVSGTSINDHSDEENIISVQKSDQNLLKFPQTIESNRINPKVLESIKLLENKLNNKRDIEIKNHLPTKDQKNSELKEKDYVLFNSGSEYLLPYPRPGRNLELIAEKFFLNAPKPTSFSNHDQSEQDNQLENFLWAYAEPTNAEKNKPFEEDMDTIGQFITPYPRIGKKNFENSVILTHSGLEQRRASANDILLPYPRIGRSHQETSDDDYDVDYEANYLTPYPRLGKRKDVLLAYPKLHKKNEVNDALLPYPRVGKRNKINDVLLPYPRLGKKDEINDILLPYPRIGKRNELNDALLPYPRLGKRSDLNDILLPYPRLGKRSELNDALLPYPRLGKRNEINDALLPYPRLGKRNEVNDILLPYPRLGKRNYRELDNNNNENNILLPYPRIGRSHKDKENDDSLDYEMKYLTPYPRIGKRFEEEELLLPYPRLGKKDNENNLLPYPRLGRSHRELLNTIEKHLSEYSTLYPKNSFERLHRSENEESRKNESINDISSAEEDNNDSNSITMIPNFRFGRSKTIQNFEKNNEHSTIERNIKLQRDNQFLSHNKLDSHRKKITAVKDRTLSNQYHNDNNVSSEQYLLPYPRPGRS